MVFPSITLTWLVLVSLKCTVVLGVAGAIVHSLGSSSPVTRHRVWGLALALIVVLPLVPAGPVSIDLSEGTMWGRDLGTARVEPASSPIAPGVARPAVGSVEPSALGADLSRDSNVATPGLSSIGLSSIAASSSAGRPFLTRWAGVIYLGGSMAVAGWVLVGFGLTWRLYHRGRPLESGLPWTITATRLLGRDVPSAMLRVSPDVASPMTFGVLRPRVLLPLAGESWSESQRESALLHELSHVRRRDFAFQLLGWFACALYWFHPLVWRATAQLRQEAEFACDESVIDEGADPLDYADQLVQLTRTGWRAAQGYVGISGRSGTALRVRRILAGTTATPRVVRRYALLPLVAASLLLGLVGLDEASQAQPRDGEADRDLPALFGAILDGDLGEVRTLIAGGADVNQRIETQRWRRGRAHGGDSRDALWDDEILRTPLATAARNGETEIARLLLESGAIVDAAPQGDATALMVAARHGHSASVALFLEWGADVNRRVSGDGTALIEGVRGGDEGIVRMLVEVGADVDAGVPGDGNPLIAAVSRGDRAMVRFLLDHGADPWASVEGDETAVEAAAAARDDATLRLLLSATSEGR